jgi:hypothetical protein
VRCHLPPARCSTLWRWRGCAGALLRFRFDVNPSARTEGITLTHPEPSAASTKH